MILAWDHLLTELCHELAEHLDSHEVSKLRCVNSRLNQGFDSATVWELSSNRLHGSLLCAEMHRFVSFHNLQYVSRCLQLPQACRVLRRGSPNTPNFLLLSLQKRNEQIFRTLAEFYGNCILTLRDHDGNTSLHVAAQTQGPYLSILLDNIGRFNLNIQNKRRETPLHRACMYGNDDNAIELIQFHPESAWYYDTARRMGSIHLATWKGMLPTVKFIVGISGWQILQSRCMMNYTCLMIACCCGNLEMVQYMLHCIHDEDRRKNYISFTCHQKQTCLHLSLLYGFTHISRLLIEECCPQIFLQTNEYGQNCLDLARFTSLHHESHRMRCRLDRLAVSDIPDDAERN